MQWYLKVVKNYVGFDGRARRTEYWMFILFNFLIGLVLSLVEMLLDMPEILSGLYSLFILLPSLAVLIRRLHDTGRSGWWFFISFVPLIGVIILIVFTCLDSQDGENKYGPNPKY
ncbi:DUF805 domain-containing protein [Bacillus sp. PS06]|uniref:DUF805 domain-containing protein n=1 Tax=Bacillus sp. PS06 TaxID=2764176 RepID=UPI00177D98A6|nr:DUF805 domain-containing protein [Bacillus sp. PS06]MBD8068616.1 DUF805 domain-containing protein [Bacillus sp. PS06]